MFFLGFYNYPERHLVLLRTLAAVFGDIIFTRPWDNMASSGDLTIETMDRTGKNLLILYNDKSVVEGKVLKEALRVEKSIIDQNEVVRF